MPTFLNDVLRELNWDNGAHLPISNEENKFLEACLNLKTKEVEKLREETEQQDSNEKELIFHRKNIQYEHHENMQLIAAQRAQLENEENLEQITSTEISKYHQDVANFEKQSNEINDRVNKTHGDIARVLRRIEFLRNNLDGEQGSLNEWRAALQRAEADLNKIAAYNKEDKNKTHDLEIKRQGLKKEYNKKHNILSQICSDLTAEESKAERISNQVMESLNRRQQIISIWASAVENLRQRDREIQNMKNETREMKQYACSRTDYANEKLEFLNTQIKNNAEAELDFMNYNNNLTKKQQEWKSLEESMKNLENELTCAKREVVNMSNELNNLRSSNKQFTKDIEKKEDTIKHLKEEIEKYKEKLSEMKNNTKTANHRIKQLNEMIDNEEKYLKQVTVENERILHQIDLSKKKLIQLNEEENFYLIEIKGYRGTINNMNTMLNKKQRDLIYIKEKLYNITLECNSANNRMAKLEGDTTNIEDYEVFEERLKQLEAVLVEKRKTTSLLQSQITRLEGELRLIHRNISNNQSEYDMLQNNLREISAETEGTMREEKNLFKSLRDFRIDESILQLKINHTQNTLRQLTNKADSLARGHLDLNAAMQERIVEANERSAIFAIQKNVLLKERGMLVGQIKAEENKIDQLKKRYDINICLLGKDEMGEAYTLTYFKIKHLQEKCELQEEGDILDAEIKKGEKEIAALEATLKVVDVANGQYIRNLDVVKTNDPEMIEYNSLCETYDNTRLIRSKIVIEARQESKKNDDLRAEIEKYNQLLEDVQIGKENLTDDFIILQKELKEQRDKLRRADEFRKKSGKAVKRKIKSSEIYLIHEKDFQSKIIKEANHSAGVQLRSLNSPNVEKRMTEEGLNISNLFGGPTVSVTIGFSLTKSSIASSRESFTERTDTDSLSERSINQSTSPSVVFKGQIRSDRSSDFSSHTERRELYSETRIQNFNKAVTGKLPVSMIVFGEDLLNEQSDSKSSISRTSKKSQQSITNIKQPRAHQ